MHMFDKVFAGLKRKVGNDLYSSDTQKNKTPYSRRKFTRRVCDTCASTINGQNFPVVDWSLGGMQVTGDTRMFSVEDEVDVMLKFKLSKNMLHIPHTGKIVRKSNEKLGLQFAPLTKKVRNDLQNVVDDYAKAHIG